MARGTAALFGTPAFLPPPPSNGRNSEGGGGMVAVGRSVGGKVEVEGPPPEIVKEIAREGGREGERKSGNKATRRQLSTSWFPTCAYDGRRTLTHARPVEERRGGRGRVGMAWQTAMAKVEIEGQNFGRAVLFVRHKLSPAGRRPEGRKRESKRRRGSQPQPQPSGLEQHNIPRRCPRMRARAARQAENVLSNHSPEFTA